MGGCGRGRSAAWEGKKRTRGAKRCCKVRRVRVEWFSRSALKGSAGGRKESTRATKKKLTGRFEFGRVVLTVDEGFTGKTEIIMFKFDLVQVHAVVVALVDDAQARLPISEVVNGLEVKGIDLGADAEVVVRALCAVSTVLDLRAGRTGGVGRTEWFKGGKSSAEPSGPVARMAKRLREEHGSSLPKGEEREAATRAANAYFEALAAGECSAMPLAEVLKKFG